MLEKKPTRLMILDDHSLVLCGMEIKIQAEADLLLLGSFSRGSTLMAALREEEVDLVVMDYSLRSGEVDGLNLIRTLKIRFPKLRLLIISSLYVPATVALALRCGASGFIGKELNSDEFVLAIRQVAAGKVYLHPDMAEALQVHEVSRLDIATPASESEVASLDVLARTSELTVREHEVLRCCLDGLSVSHIARKFSRSIKTISTQKQAAFRKLGLRGDNELYKVRYQMEGR
ncbi:MULTISPECIES: response regulator transcription factor [Pseudomonas]|uniref:Response regulator transcription factor n=1 Tax=Pseudomonas gingeri TaxID=117681 RepID=A0A7Y7WVE4_9PSED|nr:MULTISPECIES: response regulator transcription factor [Pseudomonas]MPQ66492.1 response regulator [Pseudomonas sp. MWU12-2323]NWB87282.1 response regulator transcription factor [Pseudomonas gingeri]RBH59947.1 DNA-binding response regulator [Pseudomonas sp. MWU13-2860]